MDAKREFLRHAVAALAYRASKCLRGAPKGFGETRAFPTARSASEILAHMGDLLDWAVSCVRGNPVWKKEQVKPWSAEVERFYTALKTLDDLLAQDPSPGASPEKLFQGPIADALTHVGQLATLRRIAGAPVRGESYFRADIALGRVGADQAIPAIEFD